MDCELKPKATIVPRSSVQKGKYRYSSVQVIFNTCVKAWREALSRGSFRSFYKARLEVLDENNKCILTRPTTLQAFNIATA